MFQEYFIRIINSSDRTYNNYLGISRKEYPKWEGWKLLNNYKEQEVNIDDIDDKTLDILVQNFYYMKYLETI